MEKTYLLVELTWEYDYNKILILDYRTIECFCNVILRHPDLLNNFIKKQLDLANARIEEYKPFPICDILEKVKDVKDFNQDFFVIGIPRDIQLSIEEVKETTFL